MPKVNIEELQRLREGATQGEWEHREMDGIWCGGWITTDTSDKDAEYIVALHNAFPQIIAQLEDYERYFKARPATLDKGYKMYAGYDAPCVFCTKEIGRSNSTIDGSRGAYHNDCFQRFLALEKKVEAGEKLAEEVKNMRAWAVDQDDYENGKTILMNC